MQQAMATIRGEVQYINAHGTSTPVGDVAEMGAVRNTFGEKIPAISSTKSLSGHSLGAAGVHEAIYSLLMLEHGFMAGTANLTELDEKISNMPIVGPSAQQAELNTVMSNSFGFGGTNASLVFERL